MSSTPKPNEPFLSRHFVVNLTMFLGVVDIFVNIFFGTSNLLAVPSYDQAAYALLDGKWIWLNPWQYAVGHLVNWVLIWTGVTLILLMSQSGNKLIPASSNILVVSLLPFVDVFILRGVAYVACIYGVLTLLRFLFKSDDET